MPRTCRFEAEVAQHITLALDVETDDAALPLVVHRIPAQAQSLEKGVLEPRQIGHRFALRQRTTEAALDA